ncbi:ABC transporter ATP-binding protein/permease [Streptomyces sp. NBC_01803]|nr:ABC transporter ATP-binding protein [Streptomyces sp. NBC_01803]WSA43389.1 ABC transporter ATP-binding protein/permease [Streptomyces sp. NBC_01803]
MTDPGTVGGEAVVGGEAGAGGGERGLVRQGVRFLRARPRALRALFWWSMLQCAQTFLIGYGIARALDEGFLAGHTTTGLWWLCVTGVGVAAGALSAGRVYRAVAALVEPLRDTLVRGVVARGLRRAVRDGRADGASAVSRLGHQTEIARDSFAGLVLVAQTFVFTTAGALAGLLLLAPVLLLVVLPPLLAGLAVFAWSLRPLARRQRDVLIADEGLADALGEAFGGLRDVVACGAEDRTAAEAGARVEDELRAARSLARWGVCRVLALGLGGHLPVPLLLFLAPWLLDRGVGAGALVGALTFVTQALMPALSSLVNGIGGAGARLSVVVGRLREDPPVPADPHAAPRLRSRPLLLSSARGADQPAVLLRGVTFAYGGRADPVLTGVDLTVPAGGHLAVVGPSGTGKSTLAALAAGLLAPGAGDVLLCGEPVTGRRAADLARLRVLIPQEAYVFSGTVAANLGYLRPDPVPEKELLAAADAVGADGLVARLGGPDGRVAPGRLSAGERQLLALARAYLAPAPVVLLDEATCHLDPAAEARAEHAFAARPGGTLVVIAHRLSSARRADRVLVLDGDRHFSGGHRDVLARSALYRDLAGSWSDMGSDPAGGPGDADGVHPVAGAGLADDRGQIVADGALGEPQLLGDLGHRGAVGGE